MDETSKEAFDAEWISALEALVRVRKVANSREEALVLLKDAMIGGTIWARGVPSEGKLRRNVQGALGLSKHDHFEKILISRPFWAEATEDDEAKWSWSAGEFTSSPSDEEVPSKYFDVQFAGFEIDALCEENGLTYAPEPVSNLQAALPKDKIGGRSSDKHGEPVAEVALMLYLMDEQYNAYKSEAIQQELAKAYQRHKVPTPSDKNLQGISWGIKRAVDAARNRP